LVQNHDAVAEEHFGADTDSILGLPNRHRRAGIVFPGCKPGTARNGAVIVDAANWGGIDTWKDKYDNAIANLLKGHESEHAMSSL
jgi:hypothetical protein